MENQAPEIIAPQQPKSNLILWAVIGITILAAGVGIGLIAGKYSSPVDNNQKQVQKTDIPVTSPSVAPTETADPTANWKTYTNSQEKITFDYPQNWSLAEYDKERIVVGDDRAEAVTIFFSIYSPFALESPTTDKIIEAWFNYNKGSNAQFPDGGKVLSEEFIKVDGLEATKYILVNKIVSSTQSSYQRTWVFVPNNNRITLVDYEGTNNKLFDQILSTFKFTTVKCTGVCPQLMPPAPNFCTNGTIISGGANECGCQLGPTCESFTCPQTAWVNCMPGPNAPQNPQCTTDYYSWAKKNCPNFQGIAR